MSITRRHTHLKVTRWLTRHPRVHLHFIPTSSSWLNLIERWFRDRTTRRLRRGVLRNVPDLMAAIDGYITHHNQHPRSFTWTATAEKILAKVQRARARLNKTASE